MQAFKARTENIRRQKFSKFKRDNRATNEEIFVEHSTYNRAHLRARIVKEGLLPYCCAWCGVTDTYNYKPISLQLDHINGVRDDNRLLNLRWLCPNCHSQTPTYGGRRSKVARSCCNCSKPLCKGKHELCKSCDNLSRSATAYPSDPELSALVFTKPMVAIAASLGVSDVAVAKYCKKRGIPTPGRGYWAQQSSISHPHKSSELQKHT